MTPDRHARGFGWPSGSKSRKKGCQDVPPDKMPMTSENIAPLFELTSFFEGRTEAWGVFEDRFGRLRRRFEVVMNGRWDGLEFVLDEQFTYDTGETERRSWRVTRRGEGRFSATSDECIGLADGVCDGDSVRMVYRFRLKTKSREIAVDFDDRVYRMSETTAVNRATMRKWGVKIGELSLFFKRVPSARAQVV